MQMDVEKSRMDAGRISEEKSSHGQDTHPGPEVSGNARSLGGWDKSRMENLQSLLPTTTRVGTFLLPLAADVVRESCPVRTGTMYQTINL